MTGLSVAVIGALAWGAFPADPAAPAPGPHWPLSAEQHRGAESFELGKPLLGTSYFYWYDVYSGAHIRNADGTDALTDHPPAAAMADLSYKSVNWHASQLRDIREAGIDFIMPVFWGLPGQADQWSFQGLPPLVEAHERLLGEYRRDRSRPKPAMIGMFYDTSTLRFHVPAGQAVGPGEPVDLTTPAGKDWFYLTIRDYFSMIPPSKWARIDGKPIVFLYSFGFAKGVNEALMPEVKARFEKDFGCGLFIVRETDWPVRADAWYRWGGAIELTVGDHVAGVGPGYDHSAVPGREPLIVNRKGGSFYSAQWEKLLRMKAPRRPWLVHVETWNELHEGTDIARSAEYGDAYMRLTAKYAQLFRKGAVLPASGPFAQADAVRWGPRQPGGLTVVATVADGPVTEALHQGVPSLATGPYKPGHPVSFLYLQVDDSFMFDELESAAEIAVAFLDDGGCAQLSVEYDNNDVKHGLLDGAFRATRPVAVGNTGQWRTVRLHLPDVRFAGRANGADLRVCVTGGQRRLTVREIILERRPGKATRPE